MSRFSPSWPETDHVTQEHPPACLSPPHPGAGFMDIETACWPDGVIYNHLHVNPSDLARVILMRAVEILSMSLGCCRRPRQVSCVLLWNDVFCLLLLSVVKDCDLVLFRDQFSILVCPALHGHCWGLHCWGLHCYLYLPPSAWSSTSPCTSIYCCDAAHLCFQVITVPILSTSPHICI